MSIEELIKKLEAAECGSRELDCLIANAVLGTRMYVVGGCVKDTNGKGATWYATPEHYTTSLDAALTLRPEGCAVDIHIGPHGLICEAAIHVPRKSADKQGRRVTSFEQFSAKSCREGTIHQQSAPVALCIAALRARLA